MNELMAVSQLRSEIAEPDQAAVDRMRQTMLLGLPTKPADTTAARAPARGRPRWLRWAAGRRSVLRLAVAGGLAAVVGIGGVVVTDSLTGPDGRPVVGHQAAAAELDLAAAAAIRTVDVRLEPGQYRYIQLRSVNLASIGDGACGGMSYLVTSVDETWIPQDRAHQWMLRDSSEAGREFFQPQDEQRLRECGALGEPGVQVYKAPGGLFYPPGVQQNDPNPPAVIVRNPSPAEIDAQMKAGSWQEPSDTFLAALPRDPRQLLERIHRDSSGRGEGRDAEAFVYIRDVLRSGQVPADLRAALFKAAALIPSVELSSDSVNLAGRHGAAVTIDTGGDFRVELIVDPQTGDVIGEREVVRKAGAINGLPAGTTISYSAVSHAVVDAQGATP